MNLEEPITLHLSDLNEFKTEYNLLSSVLVDKEADLAHIHEGIRDRLKLISNTEVALTIIKKMLEISNNDTVSVFSNFITTGLRSIFGKDYSVEFVIKDRGNKNKIIQILFKKDDEEPMPIDDAIGGGVQVIIGFLLQVIILKVFNKRMFILLDESLVQVSKQYLPPCMKFIKEMSREHGLVTLMITHVDLGEYADVAYEVKAGSVSEVYRSEEIVDTDPSIELIIKDFQIIKSARIKACGFTMITGPTDNGKSSIFRSIIYTLTNRSGNQFINHDAKLCKTAIAFSNFQGHEDVLIKWTKGKSAKLVIDYLGETTTLEKLGTGAEAAIKLYQPYNLDGVKMGDLYITPNWCKQMELPLTTQLDGKADLFKLFNSMSGTEDLMKVIYKLSEDIKVLTAERKAFNAQSDMLSVEVGNLKDQNEKMTNSLVEMENIDAEREKSDNLISLFSVNAVESKSIKSKLNEIDRCNQIVKLINESLASTNVINVINKQIELTTDLMLLNNNKDLYSDVVKNANETIDSSNKIIALRTYISLKRSVGKKQKYLDAFINLIPMINEIIDSSVLCQKFKTFKFDKIKLEMKNSECEVYTVLVNESENFIKSTETINGLKSYHNHSINLAKLNKLENMKTEYESLQYSVDKIDSFKEFASISNEISELNYELEQVQTKLSEVDVCPMCKQKANF